MSNFKQSEIEEIINLFESEMSTLKNVSKIEKMKVRKKVAGAVLPAIALSNMKPEMFMSIIEDRLGDVFDLFLDAWGFREKLYQTVNAIFSRLRVNKSRIREIVNS